MRIAIVGAGWAGLAAAVEATRAGHTAIVFEASRALGGRARALKHAKTDGTTLWLDNGQHILIGAYAETLRLMREVGVDADQALLRLPLTLRFPDGNGLECPDWPAPFDGLAGILGARGWNWRDKLTLLRAASAWQRAKFRCDAALNVADLCAELTPRVMAELIEPLCASALNTAANEASGQVFLRVIQDSLLGPRTGAYGGSNLLIPRVDLGQLFPAPAAAWLVAGGGEVRLGRRVAAITQPGPRWQVLADGLAEDFDAVLLACPSWEAARLVRQAGLADSEGWLADSDGLAFEAITTVYATSATRLAAPMLALRSSPAAPAQFVFDRRHLGAAHAPGHGGILAFVVSVSHGDRDTIEAQVLAQGRSQLGLEDLMPVQTIVEKRATFACTPGLRRPAMRVAPGLLACGEHVAGPYPGTLEGAVRSGVAAAAALSNPSFA
ncbi:desaturase [Rhodoferax koreense]|uniref:Desaturase n=1 Tax=Rhodoferax koreensis TaxID=1842727 RepID=A0A1P8JUQ6_9BURK|nr:hydroxysqualene dehydroxylase HpnE [Rhodoferax koreense]APW37468.1 desaturase [Rhodoferax koreense]